MQPLDRYIKGQLDQHVGGIGNLLHADVMAVSSPIRPGLDTRVRDAIEGLSDRSECIAVILHTLGGVTEVVERMVTTVRNAYDEMIVVVPDRAMSAGTIFALSADRIMMDYSSCLGPIDPQIEKDGKLIPALSYLNQFERLNKKAASRHLTTAEYALLNKLDLGELYQFEQARELSIELLVKWLSRYKFKTWTKTARRGAKVTDEMRRERAREIAKVLTDPDRWHSHGRAIDMETLQSEIGLQIEDLSVQSELHTAVRDYVALLHDYMTRQQIVSFVHTEEYF